MRFVTGLAIVVVGISAGIGLTAVLGGSADDDPCHGTGQVDRVIVGPAEEGSKEYTVCKQLGHEVIFDPDGTPVSETIREEDVIEYYKTHPAENPRVIADETADAQAAINDFMSITPPAVDNGDTCPESTSRTTFSSAALSLCMPDSWKVKLESEGALTVGDDEAIVAIYPSGTRGTAGTKCESPAVVTTKSGELSICASRLDPWNGQGHGLTFPSGREGGLSVYDIRNTSARELAFAVAYSVVEE
jgi:hypothetical protein